MTVYNALSNLATEKTALLSAIENAMKIPHYVSAADYIKKLHDAMDSLNKVSKKFDDQVQSYFPTGEAMVEGCWIYELTSKKGTQLTLSKDKAIFLASFNDDVDLVRYIVTYNDNGSKVISNIEGWNGEEFLA